MIRGAYTGVLYPGRTSSRLDAIRREAGVRPRSATGSSAGSADGETETGGAVQRLDDEIQDLAPPLVRIHSECYTGETVWSARCDCGEQLDEAARLMSLPFASSTLSTPAGTPGSETPSTPEIHTPTTRPWDPADISQPTVGGVIIYLRQEGRGIGLLSKLKAYNLQDLGHDTMEANLLLRHPGDARSYGLATAILMDLGLGGERGIRLLTNNPEKVRAVEGPNREVVVRERVAMVPLAWRTAGAEGVRSKEVEKYISTKVSFQRRWEVSLGSRLDC